MKGTFWKRWKSLTSKQKKYSKCERIRFETYSDKIIIDKVRKIDAFLLTIFLRILISFHEKQAWNEFHTK